MLPRERRKEVRNLENDKIKSGIQHCANFICEGCPYELGEDERLRLPNSAGSYVRCMQRLIEDIYAVMTEEK